MSPRAQPRLDSRCRRSPWRPIISPLATRQRRSFALTFVATRTVPSTPVFDLTTAQIQFYEYDQAGAHGVGQLVDTPPASANANAQLSSTGTVDSFGISLIAGPINTPPMLAAAGGVQASSPTPGETHLTQAQLDSVVGAATSQWAHAGASSAQLAALAAITFTVADLAGNTIGDQTAGHIVIDADAAGHGWFVEFDTERQFGIHPRRKCRQHRPVRRSGQRSGRPPRPAHRRGPRDGA